MHNRETTHAERVEIVKRHLAGERLEEVAQDMDLNFYTVRKWWRRYRQAGWVAVAPQAMGPPQVGVLGKFSPLVKYVALRLKRKHPGWGVDKLLLEMSRRLSLRDQGLPKRSALSNYLSRFGSRLYRPRLRPTARPNSPVLTASEPHHCWQIDFKGEETVNGCQLIVAPFMVCDEASGAHLQSLIHALKARSDRTGLTTRTVQEDLRHTFVQWGLPNAIRMDRDTVFIGTPRLQWPGTLLLWLVGLGIQPIINRAYRPTDNAIIERHNRTWKEHILLGESYQTIQMIQEQSDQDLIDRREYLPSRNAACQGHPPAKAFPTLNSPLRAYSIELEETLFDLKRVDQYLSQWEWQRTVDNAGKISLAAQNHRIGKEYRGQMVKVRFDPQTREFVCYDVEESELKRFLIHRVSQEYILHGDQNNHSSGGMT
ncbi:MAG: helix-turn-helix domain-containing protein [Anaerolineae bacterium]|nr:helix-turn-helix domain-containing protein [Anaerolineae bacterium]